MPEQQPGPAPEPEQEDIISNPDFEGSVEAARVPRTRDELRAIITQRRDGTPPTEEQLDYIEQAEKEGKWLG